MPVEFRLRAEAQLRDVAHNLFPQRDRVAPRSSAFLSPRTPLADEGTVGDAARETHLRAEQFPIENAQVPLVVLLEVQFAGGVVEHERRLRFALLPEKPNDPAAAYLERAHLDFRTSPRTKVQSANGLLDKQMRTVPIIRPAHVDLVGDDAAAPAQP